MKSSSNTPVVQHIAVAIVKNAEGKYLIVKRKEKKESVDGGALQWTFVSDGYEGNEKPEDAVRNFTLEETGYSIKVGKQISERIYHPFKYHLKYFVSDLEKPEQVGDPMFRETEEYRWVGVNDLPRFFTTNIDDGVRKYIGL